MSHILTANICGTDVKIESPDFEQAAAFNMLTNSDRIYDHHTVKSEKIMSCRNPYNELIEFFPEKTDPPTGTKPTRAFIMGTLGHLAKWIPANGFLISKIEGLVVYKGGTIRENLTNDELAAYVYAISRKYLSKVCVDGAQMHAINRKDMGIVLFYRDFTDPKPLFVMGFDAEVWL